MPASPVGFTNATLNGTANPDGLQMSGWFEWGTTTNYGNITPALALGSGNSNTNFSRVVGGLSSGVTYHFRAVASNSFYVVFGENRSFTTPTSPTFSDIGAGLPGVTRGSAAWGDYDNDGRLDLICTGVTNLAASGQILGAISQVWRNTTNGFVNVTSVVAPGLPGVGSSSVAWGDYDNDGRLDFLLTGFSPSVGQISQIWRNTGSGFTNINAGLPGVALGSAVWGDYDNDGRLDLLLTGNSGGYLTQIWRNTGSGFTNATQLATLGLGLPGLFYSSASWADYDNDGRLDFLLMGATNIINGFVTGSTSQLWRNTGNGFVKVTSSVIPGLPSFSVGSAAWGDYDNDGRLDLLLTGATNSSGTIGVAQIWRNTGSVFTNINAGLPAISDSSGAWGDYDNDGRLDILVTGNGTDIGNISQVWRNSGNGFTNISAALTGVASSSATWADFDNDGRLDLLVTGITNYSTRSNFVSQVWRNIGPATNTPPNAPTSLAVTVTASAVNFSWNAATDAQTPSGGLTYNLRIGTTPGGSDVLAPAAAPGGFRRVPQIGNGQQGLTAALSYNAGTPYYWSVQTVDSAFAGSAFAPEGSFRIFQSPPLVALATTTTLVPGDLNGDGMLDESELDRVLSNYFASSPWLYLTNVAGLGGTNVTFALSNSVAGAFSVEYTTDLSNWFLLGPATPRYLFIDTNAPTNPQRYYRLRWP